MSISLRADVSGTSGAVQLNGADKLVLNADGTLSGTENPATGLRSQALATMQKFADEFGALLSANGYTKLPNGMIIQWGIGSAAADNFLVTLPITFPNACFSVSLTDGAASATDAAQHILSYNATYGLLPAGFKIYFRDRLGGQAATSFTYIAIGY